MNLILNDYSQPYLYPNNNKINLLCCFASDFMEDYFNNSSYLLKPWKIHLVEGIDQNNTNSIRLNLPEHIENYGNIIIECNPCIYHNTNIITYTCGFKKSSKSAISYYMVSAQLNENSLQNFQILSKTFNGVILNNNIYQISKDKKSIETLNLNTLEKLNTFQMINEDRSSINRITNVYNTNNLIITISNSSSHYSVLTDSNLSTIETIQHDGSNIYKCSIYNNYLAYTIKQNDNRSINIISK
jgi:hypothetical protein